MLDVLKPVTGATLEVGRGRPLPFGATFDDGGCNFSVYAPEATRVELLLFDAHDDRQPSATIELDAAAHKTFQMWHCRIDGLAPGTLYAYRVDGTLRPQDGERFDRNKVLIDPYARGITKTLWRRVDACVPGDNIATSLRGVALDLRDYDWEGDRPLRRPMSESIIYEMHVGGFTRGAGAGVTHPGSFSAVVEKIPYLRALGVTAVELLPTFEFDDSEVRMVNGQALKNYWGYSTMAYFAPHSGFCVSPESGGHVREFRDMVKALHRAGIEVILDVVFNHTDEGNHQGPTFCFKGFANDTYYYLNADKRFYYDYSGCGNSLDANQPLVSKMILDCLRFWVNEMHVDGFRFDEGSVLSRGENGAPMAHPPVLWQIELDESLADTKIIAEAWDANGLYQVGHFPGFRWAEWNGRFRDDMRHFVRSDPDMIGAVQQRLSGSPDLYRAANRLPTNSINFIDAHDGFTIADLVAYDRKHNDANGEANRDGVDDNLSWNCGTEGPTDDAAIQRLRQRQMRNIAALLLLSQGVPMFVMGDELGRSQGGNNNVYCQDNAVGWFDWSLVETNKDLLRFWSRLIAFRRRHASLLRPRYFDGTRNERGLADVTWHGVDLDAPDLSDGSRSIAFTLAGTGDAADLHVIMNMYWEPLAFALPPVVDRTWARVLDTARAAPDDIVSEDLAPRVDGDRYEAEERSVVVLVSQPNQSSRR